MSFQARRTYDSFLESIREKYVKDSSTIALETRVKGLKEMLLTLETEIQNLPKDIIDPRFERLKRIRERIVLIDKELDSRKRTHKNQVLKSHLELAKKEIRNEISTP